MMSATVDDSLIAHHDTLPVLNDSSSQLPPSSQTTDSQALDLSAPAPRTSESDFAEKAAGLLRELRTNPNFLPPFRLEVVRQCVQEIQRLRNLNAEDFQRAQEAEGADVDAVLLVQMRQATIDRIKRCLCAYVNERMLRLKEIRWREAGKLSAEVKANMSEDEFRWFNSYNENLFTFQRSFGNNGINLLTMIHPPKSTVVEIWAKENYGEFETSDGLSVLFKRNSVQSIPRKDSETLVKKGVLEYT